MMHLSTAVEIAARGSHLAEIAIADIAFELRRRANEVEPAFSTRTIVPAAVPDVLVTGHELPPGVFGAVSRTRRGPVILYARGQPSPVQRFAIAHELAHLLFDGDRAFREPGVEADLEAEARADLFADELLVPIATLREYVVFWPSDELRRDLYLDMVDELASCFGVLAEVIDRRIRLLEWLVIRRA